MGGAGTEHGVTFTSEVEDSKRSVGSGDQGRGPGPASGPVSRYGEEEREDGWSSEPGLARSPRLLQTVATTQAISGDLPEDGEHGVPDSVCQSWDIIWCEPFCGHWGQHPHLTSPWWGEERHLCDQHSGISATCRAIPPLRHPSTFHLPSIQQLTKSPGLCPGCSVRPVFKLSSVQLCTHQLTPLPDSTTYLPCPPASGTSPSLPWSFRLHPPQGCHLGSSPEVKRRSFLQ